MRHQFKLLACGFVAWGLISGPSSANTIILDATSGYSYEVEPGAFITQPGIGQLGTDDPSDGVPGAGPILGVGLLFAVGTPDTADLSITNDILGHDADQVGGYFGGQAKEIIGYTGFDGTVYPAIQFTVIIGSTGNLYHIDFMSWNRDTKPCIDNDGVSCVAARGATSFNIESASPVPLPAALPLFAGGLGLMGWMARRRNKQLALNT